MLLWTHHCNFWFFDKFSTSFVLRLSSIARMLRECLISMLYLKNIVSSGLFWFIQTMPYAETQLIASIRKTKLYFWHICLNCECPFFCVFSCFLDAWKVHFEISLRMQFFRDIILQLLTLHWQHYDLAVLVRLVSSIQFTVFPKYLSYLKTFYLWLSSILILFAY